MTWLTVPVGEWKPDIADLGNTGTTATNVIPWKDSYKPFPDAEAASSNALNARCQGAFFARDNAGNVFNYAGTESKLYGLIDGNSYSDVTRTSGGAYSTGQEEWWEFIQWGNTAIATNYTDDIQFISLGGANFAALPGSPPKARHIDVVRDFVVVGNVTDTGVNYPNRVQWCAINNSQDWVVSATTQADYQDLQGDGGWVQKVVGGAYGLVFQERSIWRMTYIGSPIIFQFDKIEERRGAYAPQSVIKVGPLVFYLAEDGFYVTDGSSVSRPIGDGKVDRYFLDNLEPDYWYRINAAIDPLNKLVMWGCTFGGHQNGRPNRVLVYNWTVQRWAIIEIETEAFARFASVGYTVEGLDDVTTNLDTLTPSTDSRFWTGGAQTLAAFNSSSKLATFTGSALSATVDTGEVEHFIASRTHVTNTRPLVDGGSSTIALGTRNRLTDSVTWSGSASQNGSGECNVRSNARYHRYRVSTSGDFDFIQGVQVQAMPGDGR